MFNVHNDLILLKSLFSCGNGFYFYQAPFGNTLASMVERAGGSWGKNLRMLH